MVSAKRKVVALLLVFASCLSVLCSCSENSKDVKKTIAGATSVVAPDTSTCKPSTSITETTTTTTATTTATTTTTTTSTTSTTSTTTSTTTTKKTTQTTTSTRPVTPPTSSKKSYSISGVPVIPQMPDYPTGCETVSAIMALRYWGEEVSVTDFITDYLPKSNRFYWKNSKKYGPNPYEYFIGDPRSTQSYGCMAPVIEKALVKYFGSGDRVQNTTGTSLPELCNNYIDKNIPVMVWCTIGMIDIPKGDQWLLEDGTLFEWPTNEHCMLLIGYDKDYYYFNDPYRGAVKRYAKWLVEKRYRQMGNQSIVITK